MLDPDHTHWSPCAVPIPCPVTPWSREELEAHQRRCQPDPQAAYLLPDSVYPRLATLRRQLPPYNPPPSAWFLGIEAARGGRR